MLQQKLIDVTLLSIKMLAWIYCVRAPCTYIV